MPNEITIEVRESGISIQGAGVGHKEEEVLETLQTALDALNSDRERETHGNEIVVKSEKK